MQKKLKKGPSFVKEILLCIFLLGSSTVFLFQRVFSNFYYYFSADTSELYFPWFVYINQKLHEFALPVRNGFYLMGSSPFAARGDPSVFYPLLLILHPFLNMANNLNLAYGIYFGQQVFHYILGGLFFYLLLRKGLKLTQLASYVGCIVYVCSGSFMARFVHPPLQYSLVWYPLLFLGFILFLEQKKLIYILFDAAIVAIIILSGHAQIVYYYLAFFLFGILYFVITETKNNKFKLLFFSSLILIVGGLLAAIQILPALEFAQLASRVSPETTIKNLYNSLHPLYYLTYLVPKLFGKHQEGYWGSDYPWGNWESWLYLGVISVIFSLFSFWWKEKRLLLWLYSSFLLAGLLSLGRYTPLSSWMNQSMPFGEDLSWVNRITMVLHFFASGIVAVGAHVLFTKNLLQRKYILSLLLIIGVFVLLFWMNEHPQSVYNLQPAGRPPPTPEAFANALKSITRSLDFFAVSCFAIFTYILSKKKIIILAMYIILLVDILPIGQEFNPIDVSPGKPDEFYASTPQINEIRRDTGVFRIDGVNPRNSGMVYELQTVGGYSTTTTQTYQSIIPFVNSMYPRILDIANVKYIISAEKPQGDNQLTLVNQNIWKNNTVLPRVFFIKDYKFVTTKEEAIQLMSQPSYNPKEYVFFLKDKSPFLNGFKPGNNDSYTAIADYSTDKIKVTTSSDHDGFLFLSELQYPGWNVYVDGKKRQLFPANGVFYALPIEQGKHTVTFQFFPTRFVEGAIISFLTLAGLATGLYILRKKNLLFKVI